MGKDVSAVLDQTTEHSTVDPEPIKTPDGRKVYLGTVVSAGELVTRTEYPVPVQFVDLEGQYNSRLPPSALLTGVTAYDKNLVTVTYRSIPNLALGQRVVRKTNKVNLLSGRKGKEISEVWETWRKANLGMNIYRASSQSGSDPEMFVVNKKGEIIPAWTFLPEKSKAAESPYWDGFQAEWTTSPGSCHMYVMDSVRAGLSELHRAAKKAKGTLSIASVLPVPDGILETAEDKHVEFGCAPSLNVYGLKGNTESGRTTPLRFAGGHIHFGIIPERRRFIPEGVKFMDAYSALSCVSLFASFDVPARRRYYGLPGEYRTPAHGLEYRTLSNAWLMHPAIAHLVWDITRLGFDAAACGYTVPELFPYSQEEIVETIIEHDVPRARGLLTKNKDMWLRLLTRYYGKEPAQTAFDTVMAGAESAVKDPTDIAKNWNLGGSWASHSGNKNCIWTAAYADVAAGRKI